MLCALCGLVLAGAISARPESCRPGRHVRRAESAKQSYTSPPGYLGAPEPSPGENIGVPFAIADFDGDQRPDVARVHAGPSNSYQTEYWIQLQLTRTGSQVIGIVAPFGGLRVAASDVNGDHAVDLVLSTAWLGRPVAILLNDGHGRFTPEKPSAFPGAFRREPSERISQMGHPRGTASAARSRPGVDAALQSGHLAPRARAQIYAKLAIVVPSSPLLQQGRAPPSLL